MAHYEPPHQDLCCLQIQLFSSLVVKELTISHFSDNPYRRVGQKNGQAWNDEQVVVYHCYDRLVNFKFVGVIDFDEFIVPHKDKNFPQLFVSTTINSLTTKKNRRQNFRLQIFKTF